MTVTVRPRAATDLEACARLLVEVHRTDGYPVEGVAEPISWLTPGNAVEAWVGEVEGAVVGHALVCAATTADDAARLWLERTAEPLTRVLVFGRLFVGTAGRNHGVGERLVRTAMAYATDRDKRLVLDVMDKDRAAIRLYERLGWQHIGTVTHHFGEGGETGAQCYAAPS
ncbi:GNAT family N-acetyltransferase [Nocardia sp. NPDC057227]|uniref:GNAT family N-acetyltransferase n=1 Tax=Nocardia sp. NPDC057227 TaxID=3346056 RepID=UPI00362DABF9